MKTQIKIKKEQEDKILIPTKLLTLMSSVKLPLHIFHNNRLTPLEAIITFLKEEHNLSYHELSLLIKRDERNVWTIYHNAKKKQVFQSSRKHSFSAIKI